MMTVRGGLSDEKGANGVRVETVQNPKVTACGGCRQVGGGRGTRSVPNMFPRKGLVLDLGETRSVLKRPVDEWAGGQPGGVVNKPQV